MKKILLGMLMASMSTAYAQVTVNADMKEGFQSKPGSNTVNSSASRVIISASEQLDNGASVSAKFFIYGTRVDSMLAVDSVAGTVTIGDNRGLDVLWGNVGTYRALAPESSMACLPQSRDLTYVSPYFYGFSFGVGQKEYNMEGTKVAYNVYGARYKNANGVTVNYIKGSYSGSNKADAEASIGTTLEQGKEYLGAAYRGANVFVGGDVIKSDHDTAYRGYVGYTKGPYSGFVELYKDGNTSYPLVGARYQLSKTGFLAVEKGVGKGSDATFIGIVYRF